MQPHELSDFELEAVVGGKGPVFVGPGGWVGPGWGWGGWGGPGWGFARRAAFGPRWWW